MSVAIIAGEMGMLQPFATPDPLKENPKGEDRGKDLEQHHSSGEPVRAKAKAKQ